MVLWNWSICCCAVLCFHGAGLIPTSGEGFSLFLCSPPVNCLFKSRSLICVIPFPWRQDSVSFHHLLSSTVDQLTFHVSATFVLSGQVKSAPPSSTPQYCFLPDSAEHICWTLHLGTFVFHFMWPLPGGASGKEPTCQRRRCKRGRFDAWVRKIPWRSAWQPTPVFLPGESHGQRSLVVSCP